VPPQIASLPYVAYVPAVGPGDIDHSAAPAPGYNLYVPKPQAAALLVDLQGRVVHRWGNATGQPEAALAGRLADFLVGWQTVAAVPNLGLFAVVGRRSLLRLDADSRLLWKADLPVHHDVAVRPDGGAVVLAERQRLVENLGRRRLILDDEVVFVSPGGSTERCLSLFDVFRRDPRLGPEMQARIAARFRRLDERGVASLLGESADAAAAQALLDGRPFAGDPREALTLLRALPGSPPDLFHTNTVALLGRHPKGLWKDGDLLLCLRHWDRVVVIDPQRRQVVWTWGEGVVEEPHTPSVLDDGRLLLLDNGTRHGRSRCLEVDPESGHVLWSYQASPPAAFFTPSEGGCLPLPAGHVLVTDSAKGRAFEVTRDHRVVWEYLNPVLTDGATRRSGIYRMVRLPADVLARQPRASVDRRSAGR